MPFPGDDELPEATMPPLLRRKVPVKAGAVVPPS
jgi:hypothetical protein